MRKLQLSSLLLTLLFFSAASFAEEEVATGPMEGVHYERIKPAQPSGAPEGKVEVIEMFWYGCPHCYRFEPFIKGWLKRKDDNVIFTRIPAMLSPKWESHARFYYAAEAIGALDKLHEPLFIALHERNERLFKEADLIDFAVSRGVDRDEFTEAYKSFSVNSKVQKAKQLGNAFNINGVPAVIINGKYLTSGSHAGTYEGVIYLMQMLSKRELKEIQQ